MGFPAFPGPEFVFALYIYLLSHLFTIGKSKVQLWLSSKKGPGRAKDNAKLYADLGIAYFATFCLPSQPALRNGKATIIPLASQPLTGDLQRRWGPGLRFTLTFDMHRLSVPLKLRELVPAPLRPLSHLSSHLQIAGRLALKGSLAIMYFCP